MLITAVTCLVYFAPIFYETVSMESLKSMAIAVPIYVIIALGGTFVINKAREQEREKQAVANLLDKADSKRRELSTLYALSLKLASTLDEDEITAMLIDSASALVHNEAIAVSLLEPDGRLSPRAIQGLDEEGMTALVAEGDENPLYLSVSAVLPVVLGEAGEDPRFRDFLQETGFSSMIAVPLFASSSVVGELCCFSREEAAFDDDAAKLLLTLASEVALALEKASLYRRTCLLYPSDAADDLPCVDLGVCRIIKKKH